LEQRGQREGIIEKSQETDQNEEIAQRIENLAAKLGPKEAGETKLLSQKLSNRFNFRCSIERHTNESESSESSVFLKPEKLQEEIDACVDASSRIRGIIGMPAMT